jgi:dephospho-CoA kinase
LPGLLRVGLTGGIACGRSTAAGFMGGPGWLVLDADRIGHGLVAPGGAAVEEVLSAFGRELRAPGGGVDRRALARVVFADPLSRRRLEAILHPRILEAVDAAIAEFGRSRVGGIALVDAALMVESGAYRRYQRLVVAHCPRAVQKERLMRRDGVSSEEAEARLAAQAPLAEKTALADYLIDTGGSLDRTRAEARRVAALLEEDQRALPDLPARRKEGAAC